MSEDSYLENHGQYMAVMKNNKTKEGMEEELAKTLKRADEALVQIKTSQETSAKLTSVILELHSNPDLTVIVEEVLKKYGLQINQA